MASKPLISIIGSLNIDFVTTTPRVPEGGETLTATSLQFNPGGKGANQAVACGRASFTSPDAQDIEVEMVGAVGQDDPYYASLLKPMLEKSGVSTRAVREVKGIQTGTATILVEESGQNRIMVVPGANYDAMMDTKLLYQLATERTTPAILVMQGEIPRETVRGLLIREFALPQTQVIWNPAPVYPDGIPSRYFERVDYLVVNETEFLLLCKSMPKTAAELKKWNNPNPSMALTMISGGFCDESRVKNLIVTLGACGAFFQARGHGPRMVNARAVAKVVDTTAAGDTFVGYFAAALARHIASNGSTDTFDLEAAITRANAAAAMCVQKPGAMQSIPFNYEVEKVLNPVGGDVQP